jgi:hypothetical protein
MSERDPDEPGPDVFTDAKEAEESFAEELSAQDLSDEEADAIVAAIERGADALQVPGEMVTDEPIVHDPPLPIKIRRLRIPERIKLALTGNRDARMILIRDQNKLIRRYCLRNPRITEEEVVIMCKEKSIDEESLRFVMSRREWMKLYQVRLALTQNPRTPVPHALALMSTLMMRDIERIGKSRDVPQVVVNHARKLVIEARERQSQSK